MEESGSRLLPSAGQQHAARRQQQDRLGGFGERLQMVFHRHRYFGEGRRADPLPPAPLFGGVPTGQDFYGDGGTRLAGQHLCPLGQPRDLCFLFAVGGRPAVGERQ